MTRADYRHAAAQLSAVERRAWQEGSIQVIDRDGNWVLTDEGERRFGMALLLVVLLPFLFLAMLP